MEVKTKVTWIVEAEGCQPEGKRVDLGDVG